MDERLWPEGYSPWHCDWQDADGLKCALDAGFYVEWDEEQEGVRLSFAGCYCNSHLSQLRSGASPFFEYAGRVEVLQVRTVQAQRSLMAALRGTYS